MSGTPGTNTGHGHVWPRPDGVKVRCGGPAICSECARDLAAQPSAAQQPMVMVPADVYERLRMLAESLDIELDNIRTHVEYHHGSKRSLNRLLRVALARADYWYEMWLAGLTDYDAAPWRGDSDEHGVWALRTLLSAGPSGAEP